MTRAATKPTAGGAAARRYRVVDWLLAAGWALLAAVGTAVPGAVHEVAGEIVHSPTPSLAVRLLPALVSDDLSDGLFGSVDQPAGALFALITLVVTPGLTGWGILSRRTRPHRLLTVAIVLLLGFGNLTVVAIALYSYAAWFTDRRRLAYWSVAAAVALVAGYLGAGLTLLVAPVAIATPLALGLWIGTRRQLLANLRERAAQLEREQHLLAQRAAAAERTRIAREMHDIVAHRVSLMVVHAGGLEVTADQPATVQTASLIRDTGREALVELREVLGILHDETAEAPTAPPPTLADIDSLVEDWRAASAALTYQTTGTARPLPPPMQRTAYRVVQEGLTNAARHAPGAAVEVRLDLQPHRLTVTVDNELAACGRNPYHRPDSPTGGYGLAGLRERVALAGGELTAGPEPDGTWRLRAVLLDREAR